MKKLSFLMALIICLGCVLLTACVGDETETTITDTDVETTTEAPETTDDTAETTGDNGDNGGNGGNGGNEDNGGNGGNEVVIGDVDAAKDAYANDIYEGVTPEAIG